MPKEKNNIYVGEVTLTPDGIVIRNGSESKTFQHGDVDGFTAYLAKCALDPPKRLKEDPADWIWKDSRQVGKTKYNTVKNLYNSQKEKSFKKYYQDDFDNWYDDNIEPMKQCNEIDSIYNNIVYKSLREEEDE